MDSTGCTAHSPILQPPGLYPLHGGAVVVTSSPKEHPCHQPKNRRNSASGTLQHKIALERIERLGMGAQ